MKALHSLSVWLKNEQLGWLNEAKFFKGYDQCLWYRAYRINIVQLDFIVNFCKQNGLHLTLESSPPTYLELGTESGLYIHIK